ncbi:MAG: hypothetical protein RBS99_14300, partial [Rhodospirillales bacterium]|nr:hypothetical protein [Rhodospirillales bacterium]
MIIWFIAAACGLGVVAAAIAHAKGRSPLLWGLGGTILGIVVVPYLALAAGRQDGRSWRPERFGLPGRGGHCPHCGARVDSDAIICRVCRKPLVTRPSSEAPEAVQRRSDDADRPAREGRAATASVKPS